MNGESISCTSADVICSEGSDPSPPPAPSQCEEPSSSEVVIREDVRRRIEENRQLALQRQRDRAAGAVIEIKDEVEARLTPVPDTRPFPSLSSCNEEGSKQEDYQARCLGSVKAAKSTVCSVVRNGSQCTELADLTLLSSFGEAVCLRCRSEAEEDFAYVVKETLKNEYLLSDYLIGTMKYVTKPNPHNARWAPIKLYLRKHAESQAVAKWGSLEALREELRQRQRKQFERSVDKVQASLKVGTFSSLLSAEDGGAAAAEPRSLLSAALSRGGTTTLLPANVQSAIQQSALPHRDKSISSHMESRGGSNLSGAGARSKRRKTSSSLDGIAAIIRGEE